MPHTPDEVRAFFASSNDILDYIVLRPLSHITLNWELTWDDQAQEYEAEPDSFASLLNKTVRDLAVLTPPSKYHDNEDRLALFAIGELGWQVHKAGNRWTGVDYDCLLEQGGFADMDQRQLLWPQQDECMPPYIEGKGISTKWKNLIDECLEQF